jgi:lysophospholipase L1-like esterase
MIAICSDDTGLYKMKNFMLGIISIVVAFAFLAAGGEIAIRIWHFYTGHISNQKSFTTIVLDNEFGWLPVPNYRYIGELSDASGKTYPAEITSDDAGFRMFGNPHEKHRKKVLFLGDSFTHAVRVSNDKTYYALLKEALDIEVFALAAEGYGTLQEYMMLDKFVDEIQPDLVVLQLCNNDLINNSYDLELVSGSNNNGLRRPYLKDDEIVYRTPSNFAAVREFAANYSHFLYFIISKIDIVNANPADPSEEIIRKQGTNYPLFRESVGITEQLIRKIRERIPASTPVLAFDNDGAVPYYDELRRISEKNGIHFIASPAKALADAEHQGIVVKERDNAHWNNAGHQIVADALQPYLAEKL